DEVVERKLQTVLKTLQSAKLNIMFLEENSGRIITSLVRNNRSIEQLTIHWERGVGEEIATARYVLMALPTAGKCCISASHAHHLLSTMLSFFISQPSLQICRYGRGAMETTVTADALTRAFEMVCSS
ncbi:hypothetical protein PENTCL1PPCAC_4820, partial [Pristionchus entomophagus]